MVTRAPDDGDLYPSGVLMDAGRQLEHLDWHGHRLHHWHVGITALDGAGRFTEHVERVMGYPVYVDTGLGRAAIRAVPSESSSCHWPDRRSLGGEAGNRPPPPPPPDKG